MLGVVSCTALPEYVKMGRPGSFASLRAVQAPPQTSYETAQDLNPPGFAVAAEGGRRRRRRRRWS